VGLATAQWLAAVVVERASESGLIDVVVGAQDLIAWATAVQTRALAELDAATDPDPSGQLPEPGWDSHQRGDRKRSLATELGLVLRIPAKYAYDRLSAARALVTRAPAAVALLAEARLSPVQARDLAEALIGLPDDDGGEAVKVVLERVLPTAVDQSSSQFRAKLQRAVLSAAPKRAEELHALAVADRKVATRPDEHGTGTLWARLAAPDLVRVGDAIRDRADAYLAENPTDVRTCDQRRADALVDLIVNNAKRRGTGKRRGPIVQVTVALTTLLGDNDQPAELAGYGAIPASLARRIAADPTGTWRRLVTDPLGHLIDYGRRRYKPPPDLDEFIRGRDQACAFPHCNRPAADCELDHVLAWADGGETNQDNLTPLCASHHHLKHDHGWKLKRHSASGVTTWTSPTRHEYTNRPRKLPGGDSKIT
jgi:hypothetical protein